ncbi:M4 family metallopeptidase [Actinoplanes sp. TRM 88003]|uniref:M4 family metallopeptidase n=1 Tax=Paractinoplanes aksuensis TaxID=2939490 RepID=A0ABT1DWN8_9ACTN|nr:M4 family metallopeptidase [Actinoplanes aksuensis]MCO8275190.1 M4 family metallopeptidase [Actinoplanes aksuensis]
MAGRRLLTGVTSTIAVLAVVMTNQPAVAAPPPTEPPSRQRVAADAKTLVQRDRAVVRGGPDETYTPRSVVVDADGTRHVRIDRTYKGLPVLGGDFVVHSRPDGRLRDTTVAQKQAIKVATKPAVTAAEAATVARIPAGKRTATLVVDAVEGRPVLAWSILANDHNYIVDAATGALRRKIDTVHSAEGTGHGQLAGQVALSTTKRDDGQFELVDPARGNSETRDGQNLTRPTRDQTAAFTDADNAWGDGTPADPATLAVDVHHGVQQTWDYFKNTFGRNGVADDGRGTLAIVHDRYANGNAMWSDECFCMRFGAGDIYSKALTSQDVVAHEWAHGVTSATADLHYSGQSGGLNESTSDIFGTLVEFAANNPADPPDYLIGEESDFGGEGWPLRYMADPARDGVSVSCWDGYDRGVHYLSGVPNKFFYMLAEGSAESAPCAGAAPVTGIGRDKAGAIWYHALTRYMVSTTDFSEARAATLRSAADLHGENSAEYAAVAAAWSAVLVEATPTTPPPVDPPPSPFPVVVELDDQVSQVGEPVRLQVEATDPQDQKLVFTAEGLPTGLSISEDGLITGTPVEDRWSVVSITVTDPDGWRAYTVFSWKVHGKPTIGDPGPQRTPLGQSVSLRPYATDPDWIESWTATGLPDGLTLADLNGGWEIYGRPTKAGTFDVTLTATDSDGTSASLTFPWTIEEAGAPEPVQYLIAFWSGPSVAVYWAYPAGDVDEIQHYELKFAPDGPTVLVEDGWTSAHYLEGLDPAQARTVSVTVVYKDGRRSGPRTADVWPE